MTIPVEAELSFQDLNLSKEILLAVTNSGYIKPSLIQQQVIPLIMQGRDIIGQAETGSGKTGAFALPLLSGLKDTKGKNGPEILVLAPTRELAIQVNESFKKYAANLPWIKTACIYGGAGYKDQISRLKSGPQIVVGTPGRIIDHIEKGFLKLGNLKRLVLDEADEMLRMGFQEDVEFIVSNTPASRQTTLFSATMPKEILSLSKKYLKDPIEVKLKSSSLTAKNVSQKYWLVPEANKLNCLTRILELGSYSAVIVFVKTKVLCAELTEKINEKGYTAAPLNGDIAQNVREQTVARFKAKKFDVLVATDVAARGLDIGRVDLVVNYDIPFDPESYVHRIGRTGRAGNLGEAILFVSPRELRGLATIERTIKLKIEKSSPPTAKEINIIRIKKLKEELLEDSKKIKEDSPLRLMVRQIVEDAGLSPEELSAALLSRLYSKKSMLLKEDSEKNLDVSISDVEQDEPRRRRFRRGSGGPSGGGRGGRYGDDKRPSRSFSKKKPEGRKVGNSR